MNLLFICSRNRRRSLTAELLFATDPNHTSLSAGTSPDAETPISADLIEWADLILFMERQHARKTTERFPSLMRSKPHTILAIPDLYECMDPQLIALLQRKVAPHLRP